MDSNDEQFVHAAARHLHERLDDVQRELLLVTKEREMNDSTREEQLRKLDELAAAGTLSPEELAAAKSRLTAEAPELPAQPGRPDTGRPAQTGRKPFNPLHLFWIVPLGLITVMVVIG